MSRGWRAAGLLTKDYLISNFSTYVIIFEAKLLYLMDSYFLGLRLVPTIIEYKYMKFILSDMPNKYYLRAYLQELKKHNVAKVVRACEDSSDDNFKRVGIDVVELVFEDGTFPPQDVIDEWLKIVENHFRELPDQALAIHCKCGLGRSPTLVAIALMECGMKPKEAIAYLKVKRRGVFSKYQEEGISKYKSRYILSQICSTPEQELLVTQLNQG